jgi:DNA polymerase-4
MATNRRILHIDLDAFYCAVEEQRDPTLKGKPFAVGGRPDQRGVVASCSYAARKFGVRSAMPMARAVKICPDLQIVRGHYRDYGDASRQVMNYLRSLTSQVEQISIDEAFLDITKLSDSSEIIAKKIQTHISSEFNLPSSIGIASNKLVAKTATDYGKITQGKSNNPPYAIQIVLPGDEEKFLAPLSVDALWGVGPKTAVRLHEMNINKIGDLTTIPEEELRERFGKWGYALSKRARGIDDRPISIQHTAKSVSQETTFAKDIREEGALLETIDRLSKQISKRLVKKHTQATTVRIKLRWSNFETITRQITLNQPTNQVETIRNAAESLFKKSWTKGKPVRLIGVGVSGLAPEQLLLWDHQSKKAESEPPDKQLNSAISDLRQKFGRDIVKWGQELDENS